MTHGIHRNLAAGDYHAIDAVSASRLQLLHRSPAHMRWAIDHPDDVDTEAFKFGRAFHCSILEPDVFAATWAIEPKIDRRTNAGKAAALAFEADNAGKEIIGSNDYAACLAMAETVKSHPMASWLVANKQDIEVSALWQDAATGLECRSRADAIVPKVKTIIDLKTTTDASPDEFERSLYKWGYHRQAAFYLDGFKACGMDVRRFAFVAVEKKPPYAVCVYQIDDEAIEYGRRENRSLMNLYAQCRTNNKWPGYPDQVQTVGLPSWAIKQLESMMEAV